MRYPLTPLTESHDNVIFVLLCPSTLTFSTFAGGVAAPQPKPQRPQNENRERRAGARTQAARPVSPLTFEDKLSKFLKDSDDRMLDLKRNTESKRGGRGARRER